MFKLTNDPILQTNDPILQTPGFEIILVKDFDAHYDFDLSGALLILFTGALIHKHKGFLSQFFNCTDFSLFLLENPRLQGRFLISPQELNHYNERSQISQTGFSKNWQKHDRLKFPLVKKSWMITL